MEVPGTSKALLDRKYRTWHEDWLLLVRLQQRALQADISLHHSTLRSAHWAFSALLLQKFVATEVSFGCALTAVAREQLATWATCLSLLQASLAASFLSLISQNIVIAACGKAALWRRSLSLLVASSLQRLQPSASSIGGLLTALERGGAWAAALDVLSLARFQPSWIHGRKGGVVSVTWNAGISACAAGGWKWAVHLVEGDVWRGISRDSVGTAGFNKALAACGEETWVVAVRLLRQLFRAGPEPDTSSLCSAMGACAAGLAWVWCLQLLAAAGACGLATDSASRRAGAKAFEWRWTLRLLRNCERSARTTSAMISACSWELGAVAMAEAASFYVESDVAMHNAALGTLAGGHQWRATFHLAQHPRLRPRLRRTPAAANAVAVAAGRGRCWALALQELPQDASALGAVVSACAEARRWRRCLQLLSLPKLDSSLAAHNAVITTLGKQTLYDKASKLMRKVCLRLRPSIVTFNAALDAVGTSGRTRGLLQAMHLRMVQPDEFTYYYAISACDGSPPGALARRLLAQALCVLRQAADLSLRARHVGGSRLIVLDLIREHGSFSSTLEAAYRSFLQPVWGRLRVLQQYNPNTASTPTRLADSILEAFFGLEGHLTQLALGVANAKPRMPEIWMARGAGVDTHRELRDFPVFQVLSQWLEQGDRF
ncbi:unnamed protein product, partial [Effrenium voratum]